MGAPPSSPDPHAAVSYAEALAILAEYLLRSRLDLLSEAVSLTEATGRVLAEPVLADRDQPPFDRSTRDGLACRAGALARGVTVVGLLRAGEPWTRPALAETEAVEIMTGAAVPPGTDAVLMVEHAVRVGDRVTLAAGRDLSAGENVVPAGAEARAGATLVVPGTRLGVAHIAAAASSGYSRLEVYRRPRVGILATGDELVELDAQPAPWQIRNSNSYSLAAQVFALGGEPILAPAVPDTLQALEAAVQSAAERCDLLLLSGGVSLGKYDLVEDVLARLGARFFFTGVRIQPGKPVVFGELAMGKPFFGLPGNPVSTMVTFALFAAPVLAALGGEAGYAPRFAEARLAEPLTLRPKLRRFLPARLVSDADGAQVTPVAWQGSGDIAATARANCMIVVPELEQAGSAPLVAGARVRILLLSC